MASSWGNCWHSSGCGCSHSHHYHRGDFGDPPETPNADSGGGQSFQQIS